MDEKEVKIFLTGHKLVKITGAPAALETYRQHTHHHETALMILHHRPCDQDMEAYASAAAVASMATIPGPIRAKDGYIHFGPVRFLQKPVRWASILDSAGRKGLVDLMRFLGIPAIIAMTARRDYAETVSKLFDTTYWVEGGVVTDISQVPAAKEVA